MADTAGVRELIKQSNNKELVVVISSSSGCTYTPSAIQYLNDLLKDSLDVQYIFVLGDKLKKCEEFPAFFSQLDKRIIRVVPIAAYGPVSWGDDRKRSDDLLKDIFPEAKGDVILTPKFYIIRPQTGELLLHGSRHSLSVKNSDVVRYFLGRLK